jgi:hypothetical protein
MQEPMKTRTRAYRFDVRLIEALKRGAKRAHRTENAFVSEILKDRLAIDPLFPAFEEVRLSGDTFRTIVSATNADALEALASEIAQKNAQLIHELYESNDRTLTPQEFITELLAEHSHWFFVEGAYKPTHRSIMLRHAFGLKWSVFVKSYIRGVYNILSKDKIEIEITDQFVRIEWTPT